jgi:hypothetical protein
MEEIFFEEKKIVNEKKDISRIQEREVKINKNFDEKISIRETLKNKEHEAINIEMKNKSEGHQEKVNLDRAYEKNIEFDMSVNKKELKMKEEDKYEMEKMRRWSVKIFNIYITSKIEKLDPFLQFTIGGDFQIEVYSTKTGKTYKVPKGKRGYVEKTEVIQNIDLEIRSPFEKIIDIEMRMTYSMMSKQKLMVEVWDYNSIWMNNIKAYITKPLIDIVNGDCNIELEMYVKAKHYATIEFKCIFQEIWDWKLSFINWSVSCLLPPRENGINDTASVKDGTDGKIYKTMMTIELVKKDCLPSNAKAVSDESDSE